MKCIPVTTNGGNQNRCSKADYLWGANKPPVVLCSRKQCPIWQDSYQRANRDTIMRREMQVLEIAATKPASMSLADIRATLTKEEQNGD
jgi:hypothetical protein